MSTTNDIGFIQSIPVGYDLDGQPDGVESQTNEFPVDEES